MTTWIQDLRYGLRILAKNPGFTSVAVATLALAIGANSTIFSLMNSTLLHSLPGIERQGELVGVYRSHVKHGEALNYDTLSYPNYKDCSDKNLVFSGLAAYAYTALDLTGGAGEAERVSGATVSGNYFDVLGVRPIRGRGFLTGEEQTSEAQPAAVLSYRLWKRRFSLDPSLVGKTIELNGPPVTVVGVAPESFSGTEIGNPVDVWVPMTIVDDIV